MTALLDDAPGLRLRHVRRPSSTAWMQGAPARGVGADQGGGRRRASSCRSAACGSSPTRNMPGGEALARQFVHGKRFFLDEFGIETEEVWLPDSFGYTAALPQLIKLAGVALVPDPEDLLEPDQQVPAPHLLVGGHRRHPDLHALPARRHLQLPMQRRARSPTRRATSRRRAAPTARWCRSAGATAAAAPPAR